MEPGIKSQIRNLTCTPESTAKEIVLQVAKIFKFKVSKDVRGVSTYWKKDNLMVRLADHRTYLQTWVDNKADSNKNINYDIVIENIPTEAKTQTNSNQDFKVHEYVYKLSDLASDNQKLRAIAWDIRETLTGKAYQNNAGGKEQILENNKSIMENFDIKSFMINEGLTRVSRDRKKMQENNKPRLTEGWNDVEDGDDEIAPGFRIPKRWQGIDGKFQMPAGDMSFLAGTGGVYPKEMISKETEKAAWNAIKNWDTAEFFDFHGIADEELKDWHKENTVNTDIDTNWWHCDFSKGSEKATGRYVGFCSDDFMELEDAAENAGWGTDESSLDDFLLVLEETADIIVEVGGKDWALVWYLKKI